MPSSDSSASPGAATGDVPPSERTARDPGHDAAVSRILGFFFLALALPVLAGTWFAPLAIDRTLNVAAALALAAAGASFLAWSWRLFRRSAGGAPPSGRE